MHRGVAGTLKNLEFWLRRPFFERLRSASQEGVEAVVLTGHSLGGMYAQALLYLVWEEVTKAAPPEAIPALLSHVHCVTFGSPIVFGGQSDKAQKFLAFAFDNNRAVNYIHAHDPCPRACGSINLRQFVETSAGAAKKGLREQGYVTGSVGSRVVDEAARQLLARPDFSSLIEEMARDYDHFVPLRVLSRGRQRFHWLRSFELTADSLNDHSMLRYANMLFDAVDNSRAASFVHDQDRQV